MSISNLNYKNHCKGIEGCNIYDFSIIEHLENNQNPIFRFFSKEEYAVDFMKGKIRLSTLYSCRTLENLKARDENEGKMNTSISDKFINDTNDGKHNDFISEVNKTGSIYIGPNVKNVTFKNINTSPMNMLDAYVLCTSIEVNEYLIENFGKYYVRINYPHLFSYYLHLSMRKNKNSMYFKSEKINYSNRNVDLAKDSVKKRIGFEKDIRFSKEKEFRLMFYTKKNNIQPYFEIAPDVSQICDLLSY
ncbi:hypothetical protein [Ulvibacter litoralis]|uniref:hypothetical protein n=1 Tax=Ulvibacter litoralis TaxID=227084 RepID=UPI00111314CD|nr:hypothetical protein [Ulvibacter litoralis]GHC65206.1 hypothetical protein GCM10008083_33080 [Ulvibacter litoralis]